MITDKQIQDRIFYLQQQNKKISKMAKKSKDPKELGKCVMYAIENEHRINELTRLLKDDTNKN